MALPDKLWWNMCVCMYVLTFDYNFITYQDVILKIYHEAAWKTNSLVSDHVEPKWSFSFTVKINRKQILKIQFYFFNS